MREVTMRKNTIRAIFKVVIVLIGLLLYATPAAAETIYDEYGEVIPVYKMEKWRGSSINDTNADPRDEAIEDFYRRTNVEEIERLRVDNDTRERIYDMKLRVDRNLRVFQVEDAYGLPNKDGICKSVYVINNIDTMEERLRGCRVIEGSVIINLMEKNFRKDLKKMSFPELTEITHFLKIYRIFNLVDVGDWFPNLKVIRGEQLYRNAALVIHECKHLARVGLNSLTNILRGSVMINKNRRMCFVDSIDWARIMGLNNGSFSQYEIHISGNKRSYWCQELEDDQCRGCPGNHCWSKGHCQIEVKNDCHPLCLAGCTEPNNVNACEKCKGFLDLENNCVESCPNGTYGFHNRRCLTRKECLEKVIFVRYEGRYHYWTLNNSCVISCPGGYRADWSTGACVRCNTEAECHRTCVAPKMEYDNGNHFYLISSLYEAEKLSGCTRIEGSLILKYLNTNANSTLDDELERSLGMIKTITGVLQVSRSHGLTSLNFLRSLTSVEGFLRPTPEWFNGKPPWYEKIPEAIAVHHNNNLRRLFDWDRLEAVGGLEMKNKSIYFVSNPMLCMSEIEKLANMTNMTIDYGTTRLTPSSNGDQVFCDQRPFNMTVERRTPHSVVLAMHSVAVRSNYMVYYRESLPTDTDVRAIRRSLKECAPGDCDWRVTDDADLSPANGTHNFILESLQPAVEYIYIVRSLDKRAVVTSKMYNVSTLPAQPSPPVDLRVKDSTDSSASLSWSPPSHPRGKIAYYIVRGYYQTDQLAYLVERDYCKDKLKNDVWSETEAEKPDATPSIPASEHTAVDSKQRLGATTKPVMRSKRNPTTTETINLAKLTEILEVAPVSATEKQSGVTNFTAPENARTETDSRPEQTSMTDETMKLTSTPTQNETATQNSIYAVSRYRKYRLIRYYEMDDEDWTLAAAKEYHDKYDDFRWRMIWKDVYEMSLEKKRRGPGPCIDCEWFGPKVKEPKNMTESKAKALPETEATMCNEYELNGHVSLSKMKPGLEHCGAYIHSLLETKSHMLTAARKGSEEEQVPGRAQPPSELVEEAERGKDGRLVKFSFVVDAEANNATINDLRHYSLYVMQVSACPDPETGVPCSRDSIITVRTKPNPRADQLDPDSVDVQPVQQMARVSWTEPISANSFILNYVLSYRNTDVRNTKFEEICITAEHFREMNHTYTLPRLSSGRYELRLGAVSFYREGVPTVRFFNIEELGTERRPSIATILAVVVVLTMLGLCFILMYLRYLKSKRILYAAVNPKYELVQFDDHWEVPRENLTLVKQLGRGIFGLVHEGILQPNDVRCAVKTASSNSEVDNMNFLQEAAIMKEFSKAFHIVKLIGVVSKESPVYVIMELMELGDLKTYLLRSGAQLCDESKILPDVIILKMAAQIADGMCFLEAKKFVHRDLAARNCMVAADRTIKIGDFGLARDVYATDYYRRGDKATLPIRWMAPESIRDGRFTSASDMWSYGVVLWEITTLAQMPYHPKSNEQVIKHVQTGRTLDVPENTNETLKPLMRKCWECNPWQRPRFAQVVRILDPLVDSAFRKVSYYHNGEDPSDGKEVPLSRRELADDCYIYGDESEGMNLYLSQSPSVSDYSVKYTRFFPTYHSD